jgi:cardiolipin synthase
MRKSLLVIMLLSALMIIAFAQPVVKSATTVTTVFFEPDAGETPFLNLINGAEHSLKIEVYVMTARDVFNAINKAVERGVNVQVILTQHPYNMQAQADYAYEKLKSFGANVRWAPARFAYDHAKFLIADNSKAILGTSNLTYSGISQNFEVNVLTKDESIVKALNEVFNADWNNVPAGSAPREQLVLSPNSASDFEWLIKSAKHTLKICEEEVPEGELFDALKAAAQHGIKVQLIESYSSAKYASGMYALSQLEKYGVEIKTTKSPFIHAKMMIADDKYLFVGSENVSYTSLYKNREVGIFLSNEELISQAKNRFDELWENASALSSNNLEIKTAFLPQIVATPYTYMNKLVRTLGTVEAVFGKNIFVSYASGNKIAGIMLWLGHVSEMTPLSIGDTVRIVGSVNTYKGQLEISVVSPLKVVSHALLPLPYDAKIEELKDYNALLVTTKGVFRLGESGAYLEDGNHQVKLVSFENDLPKIPSGTEVYVKGIVMNQNGNEVLVPTEFYTANEYVPILKKNAIKTNPSLKELRKDPQLYYAQTITSTGVVAAVVSASNAYIYSDGCGMRIYGKHGNAKVGDIVQIKGTFTSYNNSFEIELLSLKVIGHTNPPSPIKIKTSELSKYPEMLVEISGKVSNVKDKNFYLSDGSGKAFIYVPTSGTPSNGENVKVIGISVRYKDIYEIYALKIEK